MIRRSGCLLPWLVASLFVGAGACRSTSPTADGVAQPAPVPSVTPDAKEDAVTTNLEDGWITTAPGEPPNRADGATVALALRTAPRLAIVAYDETLEECSGAGGSHVLFTAREPALGKVHFGGHAAALASVFGPAGELYLAAVAPLDAPVSIRNDMWCVPERLVNAYATAIVHVASLDEGRRRLGELGRR